MYFQNLVVFIDLHYDHDPTTGPSPSHWGTPFLGECIPLRIRSHKFHADQVYISRNKIKSTMCVCLYVCVFMCVCVSMYAGIYTYMYMYI